MCEIEKEWDPIHFAKEKGGRQLPDSCNSREQITKVLLSERT